MDTSPFRSLCRRLTAPVDGASLAVFRIAFGLIMVWEAARFLWPHAAGSKIRLLYADPAWHFAYPGLDWIAPWPEPFLTLHFVVLGAAALFVALGLFYRVASVVFFLAFTYVFLLDQAYYLNHFYLIALLSFLLMWMPAARCFSLDAVRCGGRRRAVPFWSVFLVRAQFFILYFYAGVAKISGDWLSGMPLLDTAQAAVDTLGGVIGAGTLAVSLAWTGMIFDLAVGPLLVWRRTRVAAILVSLVFHCSNHLLFTIGVFPFLALASTFIFCQPDWPRRAWARLTRRADEVMDEAMEVGQHRLVARLVPLLVCLWVAAHVALPLRHYFIAGDAAWTGEGDRFAWRMMLKDKQAAMLRLAVLDTGLVGFGRGNGGRFRWEAWPDRSTKALHVAVDAEQVPWRRLPPVVLVHEPYVGVRVFDNPHHGLMSRLTPEARADRLRAIWHHAFGRAPRVTRTTSLATALAEVRERVADDVTLRDRVSRLQKDLSRPSAGIEHLHGELGALVRSHHGDVVRGILARSHPFALQRARHTEDVFLVVEDPALADENRLASLAALERGRPFGVLVDFTRLGRAGWLELPRAVVCMEDGQPKVLWNHHVDLGMYQVRKMALSPFLLRRYARHVAAAWQRTTGRRPEIRVVSYVGFNKRKPQLLVDPTVDMGSVPAASWRHNPWIQPLGTGGDEAADRRRIPDPPSP